MTTPYTYKVILNQTNQFYYGVRFGLNCHPDDLWKTYFTSSNKVKGLIKKYGIDSFTIIIENVFETPEEAIKHETKTIKMLRNDPLCLNKGRIPGYSSHGSNNPAYGKTWWNNGSVEKLFKLDEVPDGWIKGHIKHKCPQCGKSGFGPQFKSRHFSYCKNRIIQ